MSTPTKLVFVVPSDCTIETRKKTGKMRRSRHGHHASVNTEEVKHIEVRQGTVTITIDVQKIADSLSWRALRAKGGKSVAFGGLCSAKVVTRHTISDRTSDPEPLADGEAYLATRNHWEEGRLLDFLADHRNFGVPLDNDAGEVFRLGCRAEQVAKFSTHEEAQTALIAAGYVFNDELGWLKS